VLLSQTRTLDGWTVAVQHTGLFATYVSLFGDPFQYAYEPILPPDLTQPPMTFPWGPEEHWYYTGGPHGGWGSGSAWAAIDFVSPTKVAGCETGIEWARAVADGVIARSDFGIVILDLDGDGYLGTGWTVVYMHLASADRAVTVGQAVRQGDAIGHPGCETGYSVATHLHIGRRYNGEWIAADCSACMLAVPQPQWNMDGWLVHSFLREYDGSLIKGEEYREACTCREPLNTVPGFGSQ
jgi:murein DD-endopeptidase MepM/ murein hydrolase activator NlpD